MIMPVEIRKLVIKAVVNENEKDGSNNQSMSNGNLPEIDKEELIDECVRQVLQILKHDNQR